MQKDAKLAGTSGVIYTYEARTIDGPWHDMAGNYAFASQTEEGYWRVFYVGETSSLRQRLANHELWPEAASFGCTHVLAHDNDDGAQARQLEQRDLIKGLCPPMNSMHDPMAPARA